MLAWAPECGWTLTCSEPGKSSRARSGRAARRCRRTRSRRSSACRQALGVLVGQPGALRLHDRREDVVLAGDELDLVVLAVALALHRRPDSGSTSATEAQGRAAAWLTVITELLGPLRHWDGAPPIFPRWARRGHARFVARTLGRGPSAPEAARRGRARVLRTANSRFRSVGSASAARGIPATSVWTSAEVADLPWGSPSPPNRPFAVLRTPDRAARVPDTSNGWNRARSWPGAAGLALASGQFIPAHARLRKSAATRSRRAERQAVEIAILRHEVPATAPEHLGPDDPPDRAAGPKSGQGRPLHVEGTARVARARGGEPDLDHRMWLEERRIVVEEPEHERVAVP